MAHKPKIQSSPMQLQPFQRRSLPRRTKLRLQPAGIEPEGLARTERTDPAHAFPTRQHGLHVRQHRPDTSAISPSAQPSS